MKLKRWFRKWAKRFWITLYSGSVKKFRSKNTNIRLVGVSGSVGKTSTKFALREALEDGQNRVLVHEGSYNDPLASLFVLMGVEYPNIDSVPALMKAYLKLKKKSKEVADFDIGILEMGTDFPGEMKQFGKFLELDVCVLTAITPEHMQNFKNMRELANEELAIVKYSKKIFANCDLVEKEYRGELDKSVLEVKYFGTADVNSVRVRSNDLQGFGVNTKREFEIKLNSLEFRIKSGLLHGHSGFVLGAALMVAGELGLNLNHAAGRLGSLSPAEGRGRLLSGLRGSVIIDDSYNNVGANVSIAALDLLYEFNAKRKIAVLGGINEMSEDLEREAHSEVAFHIKKKKLQEVVLIGSLAKKYYAPILKTSGVKFKWFSNPYRAGNYLEAEVVAGMVILVKGSQNGIYSEEVIPFILKDKEDIKQLVRQSEGWVKKKRESFGKL
ncbi:hypothetical protein KA075_03180 [Candidatus Saccharibacteria bacterium]|nr:hypothetical protein [Candidatus Saccharibacteria bacterium]